MRDLFCSIRVYLELRWSRTFAISSGKLIKLGEFFFISSLNWKCILLLSKIPPYYVLMMKFQRQQKQKMVHSTVSMDTSWISPSSDNGSFNCFGSGRWQSNLWWPTINYRTCRASNDYKHAYIHDDTMRIVQFNRRLSLCSKSANENALHDLVLLWPLLWYVDWCLSRYEKCSKCFFFQRCSNKLKVHNPMANNVAVLCVCWKVMHTSYLTRVVINKVKQTLFFTLLIVGQRCEFDRANPRRKL